MHIHLSANKIDQAGIMISGHDSTQLRSTGVMKQSSAELQNCRIKLNKWQGIFVLDGCLKCNRSDLRHNERGAMVKLKLDSAAEFCCPRS
eukprot:764589-Hanusia_phi.AAC.3